MSFHPINFLHRISARVLAGTCLVFSLLAFAWPPARHIAEAGAYVLILWLALQNRFARDILGSLSRWQKGLAGVFFALMLIGQMSDRPRKTYPFVSWTMYSNATLKLNSVVRLKANLADGRMVDVPDSIFPARALQAGPVLRQLSMRAAGDSPAGRVKLANFERAIKSAYERDQPGETVRSLVLDIGRFDLETCKGEESVVWSRIYESPPWN